MPKQKRYELRASFSALPALFAKLAAARTAALQAAGPEAIALQAKVDAARRGRFEAQRAKYGPAIPSAKLSAPATPISIKQND